MFIRINPTHRFTESPRAILVANATLRSCLAIWILEAIYKVGNHLVLIIWVNKIKSTRPQQFFGSIAQQTPDRRALVLDNPAGINHSDHIGGVFDPGAEALFTRSEEHTSELQSRGLI